MGNANNRGLSAAPTITHGLTILKDDVLLVFVHGNFTPPPLYVDNNGSTPFTPVINEQDDLPTGVSALYAIYVRIAGSSEPATYNFTQGGSFEWGIQIRQFRNVGPSIFEVVPSIATRASSPADSTTATSKSMTVSREGALGIVFVCTDSGTANPPGIYSGITGGYANEVQPVVDASGGRPNASYTKPNLVVGNYPAVNITLSVVQDWTIHQFALQAKADVERLEKIQQRRDDFW